MPVPQRKSYRNLTSVSIYVVLDAHLRRYYFYVAIYGLFECTAATVSTEIVFRSWQVGAEITQAER